jgi:outer membrane protein assembly factor BamB
MRYAPAGTRAVIVLAAAVEAAGAGDPDHVWGQWRGPRMDGVAREGNPPLEWSETRNVRWKVALPGRGSSTPVVWLNRLYLLAAVPGEGDQQEFVVLAVDRRDGRVAWKRTARKEVPHEGTQPNNTFASASAIVDGTHVIAYFGSRGLYCYDLPGRLIWQKDLGRMRTRNGFGEGASPALSGDRLVVAWDHEGPDFIVAFDKNTGKELWRRDRDEPTTWATPLIVETGGRRQVVTAGTNRVRSYDLEAGDLVWEAPGLTLNAIPTPVEADGVVYLTAGYRGNAARAIRLAGARGDLTGTPAVLWQTERDTPYVPSPLLYRAVLYLVKGNAGVLSALDAATGRTLYGPQRLPGISEIYASPVGAAGRVYVVGRDGNAVVLSGGREYQVLARNALEDGFDASPVVVGDELYLRGYHHLYRISAR